MADNHGDANGNSEKPQRNQNHDGQANGASPKENSEKQHHHDLKEKLKSKKAKLDEKSPPGGYDDTPIPKREPGYTVKFTFHKAINLPMADYGSLSSDPYLLVTLDTGLPTRHKEDPALQLRTPTIRRNTNPEWNTEWIVANVPASGFKCKVRLYDEDPTDRDDRLGNAHINISSISESWSGIQNQSYDIKKRAGSKRAYFVRAIAACMSKAKEMDAQLFVSVEVLGRTKDDNGGRAYTIGPMWYTRHYSSVLGRVTGKKDPGESKNGDDDPKKAERYNFQANQYQLHGPVPPELYHRYVEFKPWVKLMFTTSGIRGWLLSKALHHQHAVIYNFDRTTEYKKMGYEPSSETTKRFLELVHHDEGGRIFTYVITVDGLFRFTETGKEFGIDMLSKHTMHSDVNIYIAFSGEFFIRRLKDKRKPPPPDAAPDSEEQHPPEDVSGGPPQKAPSNDGSDNEYYELVIDNDSGTYRPSADQLPKLKEFLAYNFPGLHILTLDCNKDAERQQRMKKEQKEKKEKEGDGIVYRQASRSSSISSSDISELDEQERRASKNGPTEEGFLHTIKHDAHNVGSRKKEHFLGVAKGHPDGARHQDASKNDPVQASSTA